MTRRRIAVIAFGLALLPMAVHGDERWPAFYLFARYWANPDAPTATGCPLTPSTGIIRAFVMERGETGARRKLHAIAVTPGPTPGVVELVQGTPQPAPIDERTTPDTVKVLRDLLDAVGERAASFHTETMAPRLALLLCRADTLDGRRGVYHLDHFLARKTTDRDERQAIATLGCALSQGCPDPAGYAWTPARPTTITTQYDRLADVFAQLIGDFVPPPIPTPPQIEKPPKPEPAPKPGPAPKLAPDPAPVIARPAPPSVPMSPPENPRPLEPLAPVPPPARIAPADDAPHTPGLLVPLGLGIAGLAGVAGVVIWRHRRTRAATADGWANSRNDSRDRRRRRKQGPDDWSS